MKVGLQFFPAVGPQQKSAEHYWRDALRLTQIAEDLGFTSVRTVEHYFHPYGGYSPNPLIFLSAAAALTREMRLITGAVLPIFLIRLKLASDIGMLDAISRGRLEVGFARAFLPHEFQRFGISMDESRDRFNEGVAQIATLLESENVTSHGAFHSYENVTTLPRPTQSPRPPFWIAALSTPESFRAAARHGHHMMAIPLAGSHMRELLSTYRSAWHEAGRPGRGSEMLAFHMFCNASRERALELARPQLDAYLKSIVEAATDWTNGASSKDYPNYDKMIIALSEETADAQIEKGGAWIGTPDDILTAARSYSRQVGGFDTASLQVNFGDLDVESAEASMRLFAREVLPGLADL